MCSRVNNIMHITNHDTRQRHQSAKANPATGAAIHPSNTCWPEPGSWTLVYTHRSSNDHRSHVITQSHPGPNACWTLYVHTQETVSHTLHRVAVCNKTVVSDSVSMCDCRKKKESIYKQGRMCLTCWPNASTDRQSQSASFTVANHSRLIRSPQRH